MPSSLRRTAGNASGALGETQRGHILLYRFRQGPEFESLVISFERRDEYHPPSIYREVIEELFRESEDRGSEQHRAIKDKISPEKEQHDYEIAFASIAEPSPYGPLF